MLALRTNIARNLTGLLAATDPQKEQAETPRTTFSLTKNVRFNDVYFDSTCVKADIHFPIDWVLLRDAARTPPKATTLIRKHGLKRIAPMINDPGGGEALQIAVFQSEIDDPFHRTADRVPVG